MKQRKPFGRNLPPDTLKLSLCDTNSDVVDSWLWAFRDVDAVEILEGSLILCDGDTLVSPANSFADMGGGVDKVIDDYFGGAAQEKAAACFREAFFGELPVGMALAIPMPSGKRFRHLICSPTMRIPGEISGTINVYLAMRAILVVAHRHNQRSAGQIQHIAMPGLGTGVGGMDPGIAAEQMRKAYDNIVGGGWEKIVHPAMAPYAFSSRSR